MDVYDMQGGRRSTVILAVWLALVMAMPLSVIASEMAETPYQEDGTTVQLAPPVDTIEAMQLEDNFRPTYLRLLANDILYPDLPDRAPERKMVPNGVTEEPWIGPLKQYPVRPQHVGLWSTYPLRSQVNVTGPIQYRYVVANTHEQTPISGATITSTLKLDGTTTIGYSELSFSVPPAQQEEIMGQISVSEINLVRGQSLALEVTIAYGSSTDRENHLEFIYDGSTLGDYSSFLKCFTDGIALYGYDLQPKSWQFSFTDAFDLDWTTEGRKTSTINGSFDGKMFSAKNATIIPGMEAGVNKVEYPNWEVSPSNHTISISIKYNKDDSKFEFLIFEAEDKDVWRGILYKLNPKNLAIMGTAIGGVAIVLWAFVLPMFGMGRIPKRQRPGYVDDYDDGYGDEFYDDGFPDDDGYPDDDGFGPQAEADYYD